MLTTRELTTGERILIDRRRQGLNQTAAAATYELSEWQFRQCEADESDIISPPALGRLQPNEACMLMRRRAGMKRTELAAKLGISGWWLTRMERGEISADRLVTFWS
jgi:DNA-binding transcriptional regulator YiaG